MPFQADELIVNVDELPWLPVGDGAWAKLLRACPETGAWTVFLKQAAGTFAPPHRHLAPADFYVLKGRSTDAIARSDFLVTYTCDLRPNEA